MPFYEFHIPYTFPCHSLWPATHHGPLEKNVGIRVHGFERRQLQRRRRKPRDPDEKQTRQHSQSGQRPTSLLLAFVRRLFQSDRYVRQVQTADLFFVFATLRRDALPRDLLETEKRRETAHVRLSTPLHYNRAGRSRDRIEVPAVSFERCAHGRRLFAVHVARDPAADIVSDQSENETQRL